MSSLEQTLEARRDIALYETFGIPETPFGFTTIKDDEGPEAISWLFFGDKDGDETREGEPYVMGKVITSKYDLNVVMLTWFPWPTFTLFTAFE